MAAIAQYPVFQPQGWEAFAEHLSAWVMRAAQHEARLMVFPEYAAMSLTGWLAEDERADLRRQIERIQQWREPYRALHRDLARRTGAYLLAGSFPWRLDDGRYVNRAWLCGPNGETAFQDKQVMTRFEREQWHIDPGEPMRVFDTELGCLGVAICYDAEFPLLVRAQVEAGAELILVPSCTDAVAGYRRVRVGAQARALESQCLVLMSPLVGEAPWSPAVDVNVGAAGAYGPPDLGFPDDGVLAQGALNVPEWLYVKVDLAAVSRVRAEGQVFNHRHWAEQGDRTRKLERVRLRIPS